MSTLGKKNTEINKRDLKQNQSTMIRILPYLKKYKVMVILAFILTLISNICSLYAPLLSKKIISFVEGEPEVINLGEIFSFGIIMVCFYILTTIISLLLAKIVLELGQKIGKSLREDAFSKFNKVPVSYFDTHQTGDTISKFSYDIDLIATSLGQNFITFCTSLITFIGSFMMMMTLNTTLMLSFVITIPMSVILGLYWNKKVRAFHREKSKKFGELNGFIEDKISGHKTIKIYNQVENMVTKFIVKNDEWGKAHYKSDFTGASLLRTGLQFVSNLTTTLIYVHSCFMLMHGNISLAEISAFLLYSKMFTGVLNEITFILADIQSALAASDRVFDFLDEDEDKQDENVIGTSITNGNIMIKNMSFSYNSERNILKNINLDVKENEIIAIVGSTGAGKTTLINLLMRFYHVNDGGIYIDGENIENINMKTKRKSMAMVLQETWLFSGTIFENIIYSMPDTTLEQVIEITKSIKLHESIMSLDKGYDTIINEVSTNISVGQKQLITIARVMLIDAKILLLDEATSNVDSLTEIDIQHSMKKLMKNKTTFVIAHRLSTVRNADRIVVIDDGKIIEIGTHSKLIEMNGYYSNLYKSQFKNVLIDVKEKI